MATFIKLLATKIVANNFSGDLRSFNTNSEDLFSDVFNLVLSAGDNEKNATSDPDIKAEEIKSNTMTINPIKTSIVKVLIIVSNCPKIVKRYGSASASNAYRIVN